MIRATCEVTIDGARFADTGPSLVGGAPTVLDELVLSWGRDNIVDQPDASTVTFRVADRLGASTFLDLLHVGSTVDVSSVGDVPQAEGTDIVADGSFETLPVGPIGANYGTERIATVAGMSAEVRRQGGAAAGVAYIRAWLDGYMGAGSTPELYLPPAAFNRDDPTAWDSIPRAELGQVWTYSLQVFAHPQFTLRVQPVLVRYDAGRFVGQGTSQAVTGTGTWQTVTGTFRVAGSVDGQSRPGLVLQALNFPNWNRIDPTLTWDTTPGQWDHWGAFAIDDLRIIAPAATTREVLVWSGRISDIAAVASPDRNGTVVTATAVDVLAELANRYVGDEPWAVESMQSRFDRIITLSQAPGITRLIDPALAPQQVTYRDVDNQSAGGLIEELSQSVDGVLWVASHRNRGGYLWMEDTASRGALASLVLEGSVWVVRSSVPSNNPEAVTLSACALLAEPTVWRQDSSDVITSTSVTYLEQGVDEEGKPATTERTILRVDPGSYGRWGTHRYGVTTQLIAYGDAARVGARILNRSRKVAWRISGLTWDTQLPVDPTTAEANAVMDLLDGTHRLGLPILIRDMPSWSPVGEAAGVYVEGGTWTYSAGRWVLDMTVSPSSAQGQSIQWNQTNRAMTWDSVDRSVRWGDLYSVGPAATTPADLAAEETP